MHSFTYDDVEIPRDVMMGVERPFRYYSKSKIHFPSAQSVVTILLQLHPAHGLVAPTLFVCLLSFEATVGRYLLNLGCGFPRIINYKRDHSCLQNTSLQLPILGIPLKNRVGYTYHYINKTLPRVLLSYEHFGRTIVKDTLQQP